MDAAPNPVIPEITPLEDRAIRRFEFDRVFHERCRAKAHQLKTTQPGDDLSKRLQDAMRELQGVDEAVHDDASIVRGARYLGNELMGIPYALASVPEQEALKTAVRNILGHVESQL
jgi:hypothetical protein